LKIDAAPGKERRPEARNMRAGRRRMTITPQLVPDSRYTTATLVRRLLFEHALTHWRLYALSFVLMAIAAGCTAFTAYLLGDFVNQAYLHKNFHNILVLGAITIAVFTVRGAALYGQAVLLSRVGNRISAANQKRMFDKLLSKNLGFFVDRHSSEFTARLHAGANAATQVLALLILAAGRDFMTLAGLLVVMMMQDPLLFVVTLIVFPPAMFLLRNMVRRIRNIAHAQFTGGTRIVETMQETLQGLRTVKAFTLEDKMRARFDSNVGEVEHEANKWARVADRTSPLMETLGGFAIAAAIVYGGYRVIQLGSTPGEFFSFLAAFLLANEPAKRLARLNLEVNSNLVGVRVLFEIIDSPATEPADDSKPALDVTDARVEFRDVNFAYRADEPVLRGMTFTAEPGKATALVGASGGGKSTVLNLILRLYEANSGTILIDGHDIAAVSRRSLRQQTAYVGQDVFLFRGTIRENIGYGKTDASEAEIVAAATAAHAHEFITAFPRGYDTPVGEHGLQLSGGQRQRVAIARALIKNAPIILLDEATAALDSESERLVQEAVSELCKGRTTLVIAHRLSTVVHSDKILVVENGAVTESGRHEELLRRGGRYAAFYRLQLISEDEPAGPKSAAM
jgi:ATP-binding cassette subfamily B protein